MTERAFAAFSGGGAKGMVHVGALKAIEDRRIELLGLSGTSAGAIVAALGASGFRSSEIVDVDGDATIMDRLGAIDPRLRHATDLFGPGGWARIRIFRWVLRQRLEPLRAALLLWGGPVLVAVVLTRIAPGWGGPFLLGAWTAVGVAAAVLWRTVTGGLADASSFRDALGTLLQRRLFPDETGRVVRMSDYSPAPSGWRPGFAFLTKRAVSFAIRSHTLPRQATEVNGHKRNEWALCVPMDERKMDRPEQWRTVS